MACLRKILSWPLLFLLTLGGLVGFFPVGATANGCPGVTTPLYPHKFETITVSTTAVGLSPLASTRLAVVMVESNPIRYREDGANPTSAVGTRIEATMTLLVCGPSIGVIKFIRQGSADATLSVHYYGG